MAIFFKTCAQACILFFEFLIGTFLVSCLFFYTIKLLGFTFIAYQAPTVQTHLQHLAFPSFLYAFIKTTYPFFEKK